jgi:hypothetical protein
LGEVSVSQKHLQSFLKTASLLRIRGLAEDAEQNDDDVDDSSLFAKRKRKPSRQCSGSESGSTGFPCFLASRILLSSSKNNKKNLESYYFFESF